VIDIESSIHVIFISWVIARFNTWLSSLCNCTSCWLLFQYSIW